MSVDKDVLYADRARYFPWRPRLWMAAYDILTYSAVAQVCGEGSCRAMGLVLIRAQLPNSTSSSSSKPPCEGCLWQHL